MSLTIAPLVVNADSDVTIRIQPNRCLYHDDDAFCETTLLIRWKAGDKGHYCLYEKPDTLIRCWERRKKGFVYIPFKSSKSKTYYLQRDKEVLQSKVVQVAKVIRRLHKRRRRPWHLF